MKSGSNRRVYFLICYSLLIISYLKTTILAFAIYIKKGYWNRNRAGVKKTFDLNIIQYITKIAVLLILAFFTFNLSVANNSDSLQNTSLSSEKILILKTAWSNSSNAASLQYFDIQNKIGKAYLNINSGKGDFHLFQEEQKQNELGFYTNGYTKLNRWKFYGDFSYFKQTSEGVKWVDVLEPYNDNPYTLGDEVGGTYYKEYFKMCGKGAYQISDLLTFGFDLKYKAGVGARRKDPRPENEITSFNILPALVFNFNKIKLGANFRYESGKEDIELTSVTDSTYNFFHFKGLGTFTSSIELDDRSSESDLFGGGLQFNFNGDKITNVTEINFFRKATDIKRGTSFPLQVVLLEKFNTNVTSTFLFSTSEKTIKKLTLQFNDKRIYGHEPVVEPKLEQVNYQWSTLAKYTLYWFKEKEFGLDYSYYKLIDANHFNWGGKISGKMQTSESTYYFVPEANEQTLNYFQINGTLEKEFQAKTNNIIIALNGGYRKGFNSSFEIVNEETLLENVNTNFVIHDFYYFNSQLLQFGGSLQFGRKVNIYKSPIQLFLCTEYNRSVSQLNTNSDRNNMSIKLGMNF
ncbi:MAG: hypothetical protein L3J11_05520 [Draconibacterium sp.]|nr:hypothetical protein [Draconibacterium sp.]